MGKWGEERAAEFLQMHASCILERRYRCRWGEIDLIAQTGNFLCFVEVKLRKNRGVGEAREFVTKEKQRKLRETAALYLSCHETDLQPRFDVIEVYAPQGIQTTQPEILLWENAF